MRDWTEEDRHELVEVKPQLVELEDVLERSARVHRAAPMAEVPEE